MVFDPANGGKAERVSVQDGSLASPPADNPKRDGYRFDGWSEHDRIMDFSSPITRDITLKARWTPVSDWALSPDHGPASGGTSITITPPNASSLLFSTVEAHDDKLIGVTGDGRLFTWTSNDTMPAHVPSPRNTSGEVRFTSGVVGGNGYAALSWDHRIYTWSESRDTPALLDADSTTYTSIVAAKDRLMAADQKGQVHIWASKGEPTGKVISLPKLASAVKTAGNADRLLALDNKGQVWTWKPDAIDVNQIQPIKLTCRIVQISAMDHGFVLLDSTGQISYLENEQAQPESLVAPGHSAITDINSDGTQAALVDSKGHVWAWKPGQAPMRADDGSRAYAQAASINGRITAISRQGDLYGWSLDKQGQPGKPAGITTTQAPSLESASMDGQALTLSKQNDSWQTEIPARKPGPVSILITGRQDGQPFTRSLNYTVDQTMTRHARQATAYTDRFDTDGGSPVS
uniref:InlB B-repeat-containing protein n=1 Tax=Bifidobacterium asteroides TaxID=1684 RepID=A0ABS3IVR9_9BIFI